MVACPKCGNQMTFLEQSGQWYCSDCDYCPQPDKIHNKKLISRPLKIIAVLVVVAIVLIASITYILLNKPAEDATHEITIYDVSEMRGLEVLSEVPIKQITSDELREQLNKSIENMDIEELEETKLVLDALFLLDYEENLTQILLDAYSSQIMGFYDAENKEMYVVEGASSLMGSVILFHEYTHALQDQHFNLSAFINASNGDEALARNAVIEGDATLTMSLYVNTLTMIDQMKLLEEIESAENASKEIPYAIEQMMLFPYSYGYEYIWELYFDGGWPSVNDVYDDPPLSTEQIMHLEKYQAHEPPVNVEFEADVENMTLISNDTMGEFMIYIMLDHYISSDLAASAAEGWGGDRFHYYKNDTDFLSVFKIEWDSKQDAQEFNDTYNQWMNALPDDYQDIITSNCLQIEVLDKVTTIYYSSDSAIIDDLP